MTATVELARRYPNARIIFSGGDGSLVYAATSRMGVAAVRAPGASRPVVSRSRTSPATPSKTSCFSKRIAAPKPGERWLSG